MRACRAGEVFDPTRLEVIASVPVQDLARIVIGHVAHIVNPVTGQSDDATVLTKPITVDATSATAEVRLSFAAPTTLSVGTGLRVRILAVEKHGVLIVPTAALTHNDDGEKEADRAAANPNGISKNGGKEMSRVGVVFGRNVFTILFAARYTVGPSLAIGGLPYLKLRWEPAP